MKQLIKGPLDCLSVFHSLLCSNTPPSSKEEPRHIEKVGRSSSSLPGLQRTSLEKEALCVALVDSLKKTKFTDGKAKL